MPATLNDLLGISRPIIQAPMAGGPASPELVAAVSAAGGLGSFGFAHTQPEGIREAMAKLRERTRGPVNANLFVYPPPPEPGEAEVKDAAAALAPFYERLGLTPPESVTGPYAPVLEEQIDCLLEVKPEVFTFHLGLPPLETVRAFQARGVKVGGAATTVPEAGALLDLGVDFIIAQGTEAGGHRGTFAEDTESGLIGTLALTRLIVAEVTRGRIPVVAAGGIMDGAGLAAVLALGAAGAQLGTAFLDCPEAGTTAPHRRALREALAKGTRITTMFSGKPARTVANEFSRQMTEGGTARLAFPMQSSLTASLRKTAAKAGEPEAMPLWAGQAAGLSRNLPAAELLDRIMAEYEEARADLPRF